ncbi:type 1 glutamine amidotransferase domain-containing protein [Aeromonas veronii]|nr:type 1 glutamine amidotransferase domain-containing protein [Aeromonas sobria]
MNILMVLTSHDQLGNTGMKTGLWLEEFAAPYYVFKDAGATLTLSSPLGGQPPVDPKSGDENAQSEATRRFNEDDVARSELASTVPLSDIDISSYDAIFYPGGHGPLWDLAESPVSIALIERAIELGKPVGAVCHAPAVLRHVKSAAGIPLVKGKRVTGFSNSEETAIGLTDVVPFLVEEMLKDNGGVYHCADNWQSHVECDGLLITGQNPASSEATANALLNVVGK